LREQHYPFINKTKDNIMKHLFTRYGVLLSLLMLAVGSMAAVAADGTPVMTRIQKSGELVLGTSANMEPMTFKQSDGTLAGLDIDLARLMANAMDVKLVTKVMPFKDLIPALRNGEVDIVLSNMTINPARNMNVAFIGPYLTSGKCVITKEETLAKAEEVKDLNAKDVSFAVLKDSTSEKFVRTLMPNVIVKPVSNSQEGAEMVASDKVSGMLTDLPVCLSTIKNNPDAGFVTVVSLLTYEPIGVAVSGDDPLFINWTENFLERVTETAMLDVLAVKWFGELAPNQADEEE
jgi:polar amino acid transport system substrate-binding protein